MIEGLNPVLQAFLGTLFTWGVTALGSSLVFICQGDQRKFLDASLGFAAGVMTAASYWSLLEPAIEHAKFSGLYGKNGEYSFFPAVVGFLCGSLFLILADKLLPSSGSVADFYVLDEEANDRLLYLGPKRSEGFLTSSMESNLRKRGPMATNVDQPGIEMGGRPAERNSGSWKRLMLLIIAITIHNIPEGLAVGVAFGSVGRTPSSTFGKSRNLALGIGIQNFPEGLAVSIPLRASGMSPMTSFWYGQLSGMVEPVFGVVGALCIMAVDPLLPYVLSFAAGAMIFVVFDDIIPEAQSGGNGRMASIWATIGFIVMMTLDIALS